MGSRARSLLLQRLGFALQTVDGLSRSRRAGLKGRGSDRRVRQGAVCLHGVRVVQAIAERRAGSLSADRESCEFAESARRARTVIRLVWVIGKAFSFQSSFSKLAQLHQARRRDGAEDHLSS